MSKARTALLFALAACSLAAAVPAQADAFVGYYNCVLKPSNQWCDGRANSTYDGEHSWDYNEGWYPGAWDGSVTACQRIWNPDTSYQYPGSSCDANYTSNYYGVITCVCYDAEVKQISGGNHSINGMADADF
jgi:hypothetical protein